MGKRFVFRSHFLHLSQDHQDGRDIIPPFTYQESNYSQNWDALGQAIWNNNCDPNVYGSITITKNTNPSNVEQSFTFNLTGDSSQTKQVSGGSSDKFDQLLPGSYSISEAETAGWDLTNSTCTNSRASISPDKIVLTPAENISCTFTNTQRGKIIVTKYNDQNEDGQKQESEPTLDGWKINLTGSESQTTQNGQVTFDNLIPGNFTLSEDLDSQKGWKQTGISCGNEDREDLDSSNSHSITLGAGETKNCTIGNHYTSPLITIDKTNNASGNLTPGASVTYTITLNISGNFINNAVVRDLLPKGFKYRSGSWLATINGSPLVVSEPTYHSPGTWTLGDLSAGDKVVLTYIADVDTNENPGLYKDVAFAQGGDSLGNTLLAIAPDSTNFAGTQVTIDKSLSDNPSVNVINENKVSGEVLGASTDLPATGANTNILMLAVLGLFSGLLLSNIGIYIKKKYA